MVSKIDTVVDAHKVQPLADALLAWMNRAPDSDQPQCDAFNTLHDAIRQATKAETIEWLAALAERYGFKPPGETK